MLSTDMTEARNNRIVIDDFDGDVVQQLVCYIHSADTYHTLDTAHDLLRIADKYDVWGLKMLALNELSTDISVETVCATLDLAHIVPDAEELRDQCCEFILQNSKAVKAHASWQTLSDSAKAFLEDHYLWLQKI